MSILSIDFETRSCVDLKTCGVYVYAESPTTDIWCMAWAFDDEEPEIWRPLDSGGGLEPRLRNPLPLRIFSHIKSGGEIRAWNAQFERTIWREIMVKRYGAPIVNDTQWRCTAAEAAAMALPRSLDECALVLKVAEQKDQEGYEQMMRMARPRSYLEDGSPVWWDVPERKQRLYTYCKQDVRTERAAAKALRRLVPGEQAMYHLDQRMNDRGITLDLELVRAAQRVAAIALLRANEDISRITGGAVNKVTNHLAITKWVNEQGVETPGVAKAQLAELLEGELPTAVRDALTTRAESGRTSLAKLVSMTKVACRDGRARGLMLYHGASTGRWSGKLLQPHNFPRGEVKEIERLIEPMLRGDYDEIDMIAHPIVAISSMLRSMLTAAGDEIALIAGDFSTIEARVLNWLAGEEETLADFRAMDAGDVSRHPYKKMAVRMGRAERTEDIVKGSDDYQAGKAAELGYGFGMGAKKGVDAAWKVYQVRMTLEQSEQAKTAYRESHPHVKDFWYEMQRGAIKAVQNAGEVVLCGARKNVKLVKVGGYLYLVLPSGRPLCYAAPSVSLEVPPWGGEPAPSLSYWGMSTNAFQKGWCQQRTYGGHLVENVVQALARDLMAQAKMRCEDAGYLPLMSVHDEIVCERAASEIDMKEYERLLCEVPTWATGCPVAIEAWTGFRYRK